MTEVNVDRPDSLHYFLFLPTIRSEPLSNPVSQPEVLCVNSRSLRARAVVPGDKLGGVTEASQKQMNFSELIDE